MNRNCRCSHHCLRPPIQCCHCYSNETYCSCSLPIEEIFTWICISSLIISFYNTIKICILIGVLLFVIYWLCQQTNLLQWLKDNIVKKKFTSKNIENEPTTNESMPLIENTQDSPLSTESFSNPST